MLDHFFSLLHVFGSAKQILQKRNKNDIRLGHGWLFIAIAPVVLINSWSKHLLQVEDCMMNQNGQSVFLINNNKQDFCIHVAHQVQSLIII